MLVPDPVRAPYSPFRADSTPANVPVLQQPAPRSRKRLVIALAAGGAALAGIVIAAVALGGDDAPDRSRDAVIRQSIAALAAGDEDKLFALADPVHAFTKVVRCEKRSSDDSSDPLFETKRARRAADDYRDPEKIEQRWRKDVGFLLRRTKGTTLEIVDILTEVPPPMGTKPKKPKKDDDDEDDDDKKKDRYADDDEDRPERDKEYKTTTYKKGQEVFPGCYAKVPFRQQLVKVAIDIKEGDREFTQRVKVALQEIDGKWYLGSPPSLNVGLDVVLTDLQSWRDKACKCSDATCVETLEEAHGRLSYAQYDLDRGADLPKDMLTRIEKVQSERRVCEATARGGPELAKYKQLKEQVCACVDEECSRKLELEMLAVRSKVEENVRRAPASYEVTRQLGDIALQASECTRKLTLQRARVFSAFPSGGELAGGTSVRIGGTNLMATPRKVKVFFGAKESPNARIANDYEIVAEAPPADAEGFVELRVELEPGGSLRVPYGFTYRKPLELKKPMPAKPRPRKIVDPF